MQNPGRKISILFLCTGNSCRSQMAEGWARFLKSEVLDVYSAGVATHGLNPHAVAVMKEAGVDISGHVSKHVETLSHVPFDYVITVCDAAREQCPLFPGKTRILSQSFEDPPLTAKGMEGEDALNVYRRVRDEIRQFIETFPQGLE